jgi:hypothetical protein
VVQEAVGDLRETVAKDDNARSDGRVSQRGLVNQHVQALAVEVGAARFETRIGTDPAIPVETDLAVLTRAVEATREIANDLKRTVEGLDGWVTAGVRVAGGMVARSADRSWRGMRTVVSLVRRRLAGRPVATPPVTGAEPLSEFNTIAGLISRARTLHDTGRYAEAEPLYREAVAAGERVLGREHPRVLGWRQNLSALLRDTGRHD